MFTLEELRKLDIKKLKEEIQKVEKDLFKIRFDVKSGQSKAGHLVKKNKIYLARTNTILRERRDESKTNL
ncbi:MAG: 50S ribosomal protein L29 [Candidatus Gracilibacteria bacterium]